ncbi:hypothetical protein H9P43_006243 [Blastocladiella emersonii ATCC 22665]|nr:hypothetical protein H9P43_006243 [Blastocladiella emersonii ATCC 22665]
MSPLTSSPTSSVPAMAALPLTTAGLGSAPPPPPPKAPADRRHDSSVAIDFGLDDVELDGHHRHHHHHRVETVYPSPPLSTSSPPSSSVRPLRASTAASSNPSRGPASKPAAAARSLYMRANGLIRLRFRKLARGLGHYPGAVHARVRSLVAAPSPADVEELKKMFVPLSSLASLCLLAVGPLVVPTAYTAILFAFFFITMFVNYSHLVRFLLVLPKLQRTVSAWAANPKPAVPFHHVHAIILPNYQEPIGLLRSTLRQLALHSAARDHYLVVLAMEAAEGPDAEAKAATLSQEFSHRFHSVLVTVHPAGLPGECRGKGANVAWAAAQVDRHVRHRQLDPARVILTVADADAGISELYFSEVEREMVQTPAHGARPLVDAQFRLFCPPIFFARNTQAVPAAVRAADAAWSLAFMQNLGSARGLHFPCSSYSVTLPLARHVGGWDTTADAIGEDMHMFLKCFYKTRGLARSTPIFAPVNLANVQANGYWGTIAARYTQARRHFAGSADSLYALRHTFWPEAMDLPSSAGLPASTPKFTDRLLCLMHVFEAHMVPATSWLSMLALPATALLNPSLAASPAFASGIATLSMLMLLPYVSLALLYEYTHRMLARNGMLTGPSGDLAAAMATRKWRNLLDYALLPLCLLGFVAAPATSHCANAFRILVLRRGAKEFTYVVAEKGSGEDDQEVSVELEAVVSTELSPATHAVDSARAASPSTAAASASTSPALSDDRDSAFGDFPSPLLPVALPATPSSVWAAAAAARARAANRAAAVPNLVLPPAVSATQPPQPQGQKRLLEVPRRGHAKHDSGVFDVATDAPVSPPPPLVPGARWAAGVGEPTSAAAHVESM